MPNITKLMGRTLPGASQVMGAYEGGVSIYNLLKSMHGVQDEGGEGGSVPMKDIVKWLDKNKTPQEKFTVHNKEYRLPRDETAHNRMSYRTKWSNQDPRFSYIAHPRALGVKEKGMYDDVLDFHSQNTKWDYDVKSLVESLKSLKRNKGKKGGTLELLHQKADKEMESYDIDIPVGLWDDMKQATLDYEFNPESPEELGDHLADSYLNDRFEGDDYSYASDDEIHYALGDMGLLKVLYKLKKKSFSATDEGAKLYLQEKLHRYLVPDDPDDITQEDEYGNPPKRTPARNSIWMSVLDAMKRQEKQEKEKK